MGIFVIIAFLFLISVAPINTSAGKMGHFYRANDLMQSRVSSQAEVREAGLWIKEHSNPQDLVISQSEPQMMYYSERKTVAFTNPFVFPQGSNKENFTSFVFENRPKYLVLSVFEPHPDWAYSYPQENSNFLVPVQAYLANQNQPMLVIYEFNYSKGLSFNSTNN